MRLGASALAGAIGSLQEFMFAVFGLGMIVAATGLPIIARRVD